VDKVLSGVLDFTELMVVNHNLKVMRILRLYLRATAQSNEVKNESISNVSKAYCRHPL
jgi:hypothetical protein